jgi:hypothetical protein
MARKKSPTDLKAAKEKKQKKIAIGGALLLVVLLIVQVPRTMKMLNSGEAASQPQVTSPDPSQPPAAPPSGEPLAPPTLDEANPNPTADAPVAVPAGEPLAQLVSFSRFASKDPFAQQIGGETAAPKPGAGPGAGSPDDGILDPDPDEGEASGDEAQQHGSAQISVNGVVETVALEAGFPQVTPMFILDALKAKSATIKVAEGGSFASGGGTLELQVGKPLTLVNTADGTRFVVELKSVS